MSPTLVGLIRTSVGRLVDARAVCLLFMLFDGHGSLLRSTFGLVVEL